MSLGSSLPPPVQARSRRTLARLVSGAERLLAKRPFEAVTVQDLCREAGCTTGAFYGRFRSKEDLLPHLGAAFHGRLAARLETALGARDEAALSLAAVLELYVRQVLAGHQEQPRLARELALSALRSARPETAADSAPRGRIVALLRRLAPRAPPGEAAFVLSVLDLVIRDAVLSGAAEAGAAAGREALVRRLIWMGLVHLETRTEG